MKKIIIIIAFIIVGIAGYFFLGKEEMTDNSIKKFISKNINNPIVIYKDNLSLGQANNSLYLTIINFSENNIRSVLYLNSNYGDNKHSIRKEIPLISTIIRGKVKYDNKDFGYGKIVTKIDFNKVKDIPDYINKDTFVNTSYIDLYGNLTNVMKISPINRNIKNNGKLLFKGISSRSDYSILTNKLHKFNLNFLGYNVYDKFGHLNIAPTNIDIIEKGNSYEANLSKFYVDFKDLVLNKSIKLDFDKVTHKLTNKKVADLSKPLYDVKSIFKKISLIVNDKLLLLTDTNFDISNNYDKNTLSFNLKLSSNIDDKNKFIPIIHPKLLSINSRSTINPVLYNNYYNKKKRNDIDLIEYLKKSNSENNTTINIKSSEGDIHIKLKLLLNSIAKSIPADKILEYIKNKNIFNILKIINSDLIITVDKNIVSMAGLSIPIMALGAKLINGNYMLRAELKDGKITVNNKRIPFM